MQHDTEHSQAASVPTSRPDMTSLNVENLDVQELERRLELAVAAAPDPGCWILGLF